MTSTVLDHEQMIGTKKTKAENDLIAARVEKKKKRKGEVDMSEWTGIGS